MKKNFENELTTKTCYCCTGKKAAFTLAETLITVAILGVVAAITIPAIINHQTESANRTKLKKAMTTYEKALNQMIIENDLKTNQAINDFGSEGENCKNTTEYFKKVEGSGCRFKTADRIWWDITDIENPLVMLKDKYKEEEIAALKELAKKEDDREVFGMVGRLDDSIGVLRINDKGAETTTPNKEYMAKLYNFSNNQKEETSCGVMCKTSKMTECEVNDEDGMYAPAPKNCYQMRDLYVNYFDENGNEIMGYNGCRGGRGIGCSYIDFNGNTPLKDSRYSVYENYATFAIDSSSENDFDTAFAFCGCIKNNTNNSIACYSSGNCYDSMFGDANIKKISCPMTLDELKALFK